MKQCPLNNNIEDCEDCAWNFGANGRCAIFSIAADLSRIVELMEEEKKEG